jgi:GT2 family glycosyltransferase
MTQERNVVVVPARNEGARIFDAVMALRLQTVPPAAIVVVNNGSTDGTSAMVKGLQAVEPNIHLLHEPQEGVAHAANTGFRFAREDLEATIISRTDADTLPDATWNETILGYFASHPNAQLLTGPSYPRTDGDFRKRDDVLWPMARHLYRAFNVLTTRSRLPLRVAHGHNLAIRSKAFEEIGGFPQQTWEEVLENVELSRRVLARYGSEGLAYSSDLRVYTSMRRVRRAGYLGIALARGNLARPPDYSKYEAHHKTDAS